MCDAVSAWDARAVVSHSSTLLLIDLHFDCFQAVARVAADQAAETRCMLQLRAHASHKTIFSESTTSRGTPGASPAPVVEHRGMWQAAVTLPLNRARWDDVFAGGGGKKICRLEVGAASVMAVHFVRLLTFDRLT